MKVQVLILLVSHLQGRGQGGREAGRQGSWVRDSPWPEESASISEGP